MQAQFSFSQLLMICTAAASTKNMWRDCFSHFDQHVAFTNVNTLQKQAKYEQEEGKHSFQPSWQSKSPWFSFVPGFPCLPAATTTDVMYWKLVVK